MDAADRSDRRVVRYEVQPRHMVIGLCLAVGLIFFAATVAEPVKDEPTPVPDTVYVPTQQPVGGLTSEDLENLRALLAVIAERGHLTPDEQRVVDMAQDVVDGVDAGDVTLTPSTQPPAQPTPTAPPTTRPPQRPAPTTTTQPPRPPRVTVPDVGDLLDDLRDDFTPTTAP